jgi:hypothetical protein
MGHKGLFFSFSRKKEASALKTEKLAIRLVFRGIFGIRAPKTTGCDTISIPFQAGRKQLHSGATVLATIGGGKRPLLFFAHPRTHPGVHMSNSAQPIIMTLLSALIIPILLDMWKNRGKKAEISGDKKTGPGHSLSSRQLFFARLVFTAILAFPLGMLVGSIRDYGSEIEWTDAFSFEDFAFFHGVATALFMAAIWFLLSLYGPLKSTAKES